MLIWPVSTLGTRLSTPSFALDPAVGRRRAAAVDEVIAKGEDPGPLAGLVTAHKDLEETADFPTSFGSPLFGADHRPTADGCWWPG